jgi:hypothetical protein
MPESLDFETSGAEQSLQQLRRINAELTRIIANSAAAKASIQGMGRPGYGGTGVGGSLGMGGGVSAGTMASGGGNSLGVATSTAIGSATASKITLEELWKQKPHLIDIAKQWTVNYTNNTEFFRSMAPRGNIGKIIQGLRQHGSMHLLNMNTPFGQGIDTAVFYSQSAGREIAKVRAREQAAKSLTTRFSGFSKQWAKKSAFALTQGLGSKIGFGLRAATGPGILVAAPTLVSDILQYQRALDQGMDEVSKARRTQMDAEVYAGMFGHSVPKMLQYRFNRDELDLNDPFLAVPRASGHALTEESGTGQKQVQISTEIYNRYPYFKSNPAGAQATFQVAWSLPAHRRAGYIAEAAAWYATGSNYVPLVSRNLSARVGRGV